MSESPLEKVLRLTGGITRSYVRSGPRGPVRVSQYANHRRVTWSSLKPGEVVQIAGINYKVLQVRVPQKPFSPKQAGPNTKGTTSGKNTGSKGKAVNTKGGGPAGSAGKGVNTAGGASPLSPGKAALGGQKAPAGVQKQVNVLENMTTGYRYYVTLPVNWMLTALS